MIKAPFKKLITTVPPLNEKGRSFYSDDRFIHQLIGKEVEVFSIHMDEGEIKFVSVRVGETNSTTLFAHNFSQDIIIQEENETK